MKLGTKFTHVDWGKWDSLLGSEPDQQLANRIGCDRSAVGSRRVALGISTYHPRKTDNKMIKCGCGCGESFLEYDARGRARKYLPEHWGKLQPNTLKTIACDNCGKKMKRPRWHRSAGYRYAFCSRKCAGKFRSKHGLMRGKNNGHYNTITVPCAGRCGATVSKAASLVNRRNGRVFCKDCTYLTRKGKSGFYMDYPPEFNNTLRKQIRTRDTYTCQECGKEQKRIGHTLHVHHVDYNKENNDPSNLISLCRKCHGKTNFGPSKWKERFKRIMSSRHL